ncbi:MAG TPA: rhomboid family intramembrane serine protease [Cellulomonadaceae bacterium]|nr:rhomboid family intramembrane serine protease [Cellulomonadaceae bacterium]
MTITIIGLNVLSYLLQLVVPGYQYALIFAPSVGDVEPYRFLTAAFLHASIPHIAFNMIALWFIGPYLEIVLGRWRYVALYLLAALGGDVMVLLLADPTGPSWRTGVLGASGAIFGLFGAVVLVARRLGQSVRSMFVVIALNLVMSFTLAGISWQGHIGGLVTGLILGAVFAYAPRPRQRHAALVATVGLGLVLVLITVLRYASVGA